MLTRYAVNWLEKQKDTDKPFFLYLSHKAVHAEFTPEEKYRGKFANKPFKAPSSKEKVVGNSLNPPPLAT